MKWVINGGTGELEPINSAKLNLGQRFNLGGLAGRQRFAEAGLADPANNIVKGQDLGKGIQQRLKFGKIKYVTSAVEDTILQDHKSYKDAKDFREMLIKKYKIGQIKAYEGKYNYKELIKDKDFEDFWKEKVDGKKPLTRGGKFKKRRVEDAIQAVRKKYKLKPNDYEKIFNKVVEEVRISEVIKHGRGKPGQKKLVSTGILESLIETFKTSYKPNVGTINVANMEKLLKLPQGDLTRLMSHIDKPYPKEAFRFTDTDVVSRINKAAALKDVLAQEGIKYSRFTKSGGEGAGSAEYRFKLDSNKDKAVKKFKKLEKSKTFGFPEKIPPKSQSVKQTITTLSKQSDEYKKYGYGRDRGAINSLTNALNNNLKSMSDKELYNFVDKNPKIKNLVTANFNAKTGEIKNVSLNKLSMEQIRTNAQFEVDHIRGMSTVDFDTATKKILDGLDIEYPKNLYIIPKAVNNSVKKQVENYVANFPKETEKIKKIDKYFKDNKISYYNRKTGTYGGYKPSKSALDLGHLGITKISELKKLLSGTYTDTKGVKRVITKDVDKLIAALIERNKARGGTFLIDDINKVSTAIQSIMSKKNSGLNIVDIAKWGRAELSALDDIAGKLPSKALSAFGKILKFAGIASIPLDVVPFVQARDLGIDKWGVVGGKNLAEMYTNLPGMIWEAGEWVASKVQGKEHEWKPFYEKTFGQEATAKALRETSVKDLIKNITAQAEASKKIHAGQQIDTTWSKEKLNNQINKALKLKAYYDSNPDVLPAKEEKQFTDNLTGVDQYIINRGI